MEADRLQQVHIRDLKKIPLNLRRSERIHARFSEGDTYLAG